MRRLSLVLLALAAAAALACDDRGARLPASAPGATADPRPAPPPPELAAIVVAEEELHACLAARADRVAAALDAGQRLPPQEPRERACLETGVERVLGLPPEPRRPLSEWWIGLEALRSCRGQLAFATTSAGDLATLAETASPAEQAEWLRVHAAQCGVLLRELRALVGDPA